jgi:hypothetical protein
LSADIERAFLREARARGLSLDDFITEMVRSRAEKIAAQSETGECFVAQLGCEDGVPVLRADKPIAISVIDETLDEIRRERENAILGRAD